MQNAWAPPFQSGGRVRTAFCVKVDYDAVHFYISGGIYQYLIFERN